MKSEWKVSSNYIGDTKKFIVYRLCDASTVDHSGNREYATEYISNRNEAEEIAKRLNSDNILAAGLFN